MFTILNRILQQHMRLVSYIKDWDQKVVILGSFFTFAWALVCRVWCRVRRLVYGHFVFHLLHVRWSHKTEWHAGLTKRDNVNMFAKWLPCTAAAGISEIAAIFVRSQLHSPTKPTDHVHAPVYGVCVTLWLSAACSIKCLIFISRLLYRSMAMFLLSHLRRWRWASRKRRRYCVSFEGSTWPFREKDIVDKCHHYFCLFLKKGHDKEISRPLRGRLCWRRLNTLSFKTSLVVQFFKIEIYTI